MELETINRQICSVVRLREVLVVIPPQDGIVLHAARAAARDPPLRIAAVLPVAVVCFRAPEERGLRGNLARKRCHKRNNAKQSKRDETPLADMRSTRRRECVGTHFACGCFKQRGSGWFSDPRQCAATGVKSSCKDKNFSGNHRNLCEIVLFFRTLADE